MTSAGRGRGRATIVDVARAAEVSRQTVSNVVNNPAAGRPRHPRAGAPRDRAPRLPAEPGRPVAASRSGPTRLGIELNSLGVRRLGSILDSFFVELTVASRPARRPPGARSPRPSTTGRSRPTRTSWPATWSTRSSSPTPATTTRGPPWLRDHGIPSPRSAASGTTPPSPGGSTWTAAPAWPRPSTTCSRPATTGSASSAGRRGRPWATSGGPDGWARPREAGGGRTRLAGQRPAGRRPRGRGRGPVHRRDRTRRRGRRAPRTRSRWAPGWSCASAG